MFKRLLSIFLCILATNPAMASATADAGVSLTGVKAAVLVEPTTGESIIGVDEQTEHCVAGLSKLPALLTIAQAFDEGTIQQDAGVRVSRHAASISGPTAFLNADSVCPASELIKAAVMISAGDAIMALGEHAFGSEDVFVDNINATLRLAGIFRETERAMGDGMLFSAKELALLGRTAIKSETFLRYSACYMDEVAHPDGRVTELVNANRLIRSYAGCAGLMTGSSPADGYSGVFYAFRNGMPLIAVVIGTANAADRFTAAEKLFDHGFTNYRLFRISGAGEVMAENVPVRGGAVKTISLISREEAALLLPKNAGEPKPEPRIPEFLSAPVDAEVEAGQILFADENGRRLAEIRLFPMEDVESFGFTDILKKIAASYLGRV